MNKTKPNAKPVTPAKPDEIKEVKKIDLLRVVDTAMMAEHMLKLAHDLVWNGIGDNGCDVDELTILSCVLDRAAAQLRESTTLADKLFKATWKAEAGIKAEAPAL